MENTLVEEYLLKWLELMIFKYKTPEKNGLTKRLD